MTQKARAPSAISDEERKRSPGKRGQNRSGIGKLKSAENCCLSAIGGNGDSSLGSHFLSRTRRNYAPATI